MLCRDLIPGRLSSFEIASGSSHITIFNLHLESEEHDFRTIPRMAMRVGEHFKNALGLKILAGDFNFEPSSVSLEQSTGHRRKEELIRRELGK